MWKWAVALAAALMVVIGAAPAVAQEASPAASPTAITGVPDPADCTIAPRSYQDLAALIASPVAAVPAATPAAPALPQGEPVDAQTQAAVLATVHEGVACINANKIMSLLSIYSDSLVNRFLSGESLSKAQYDQILDAQPLPPDKRTEITNVEGMVKLPDGRIAVVIVGDDLSNPKPPSPTLFILGQHDGTWQIDDFVKTSSPATPIAATPTP
jgi:hypothetical protein